MEYVVKLLPILAGALLVTPAPTLANDEDFDPRRHFYFHIGSSKSLDQVKEDYRVCSMQARPVLSFNDKINNNTGLLGGFMASKDRRNMRAAIMRRCMAFKGYKRFAMSEASWREIVGEGDMAILNDGAINEAAHETLAAMAIAPDGEGKELPA